ncbi:MAG: ABC transporter substrate-binding protein [Gaiellales bacterium]|nr:ABC transporter substrate-binding protein [Gaiellales bacterium]
MRKAIIVFSVIALMILGTFIIAGCGESTTTTAAPTTTTAASTGIKPLDPLVKVTVAFDDAPGTAGLILADQLGYFKDMGIEIEWKKFNTGADMYTALAADKVDVGRGITTASLYNGTAQGIRVWVVADSGTNVEGRNNYFGVVVRKDLENEIKDYADLKGRNCLIVSKGSINERFLRLALAKGNLTVDDVKVTIIDSFPDLNTALGNKAADVAVQIEPLITSGVDNGILVPFAKDASDYAAGQQVAVLLYSDSFAKKTDVANAFMYAHLKGVRKYNDAVIYQKGADMDQIIDVLVKNTFVQDPEMWKKMNPTGLNVDGSVLEDAVAADQDFYAGIGQVPTKVNMKDVIDMSFAKAAAAALGPYEPPE